MGLAAPKNRIKLSHDPNNTKWTNDTSSFGHKIMTSQGWQPGDHLGVQGAAHAEFHTDANFSHIRVAIKDDNLGLGAKIGSGVGPGECTGLDAFQNLLGRLNGRDEDEMEKEQKSREDLKRAIYAEQRWGTIRFVKGGLLVGDKIQPLIDAEAERVRKLNGVGSSSDLSSEESEEEMSIVEVVKKSKKRKLEDTVEPASEVVAIKVKKSKKQKLEREGNVAGEAALKIKKSKRSKSKLESSSTTEDDLAQEEAKLSKKKSKREKNSKSASDEMQDDEERSERSRRKREKEERKRDGRERKDKARTEEEESPKESKSKSKRDKKKDKRNTKADSESSKFVTKESTPVVADSSGRSTPMMQGRHAVRARNIAQKRLASMDVASLNQIFMIKS